MYLSCPSVSVHLAVRGRQDERGGEGERGGGKTILSLHNILCGARYRHLHDYKLDYILCNTQTRILS